MMFLEKYIINNKKIIGVELLIKNDSYEWRTVDIVKQKNEIKYSNAEKYSTTEIPKELIAKKNIPLVISITGKGIIHKKINNLNTTDENLLNQAIPNIHTSEFYFQKYYTDVNTGFISLVRKTNLDVILSLVKENQLTILELYIGPYLFSDFIQMISLRNEEYSVSEYVLEYQNDQLFSIKSNYHEDTQSVHTYKIDDDNISCDMILAYSASIFLVEEEYQQKYIHNIHFVEEEILEYKYRQYYKKGALVSLLFIFSVLLVNIIFYSILFDKNRELTENKSLMDSDVKLAQEQKNNINKSRDFLKKIGWEDKNRLSPFIDDIASTVPTSILLTELTIHPRVKFNSSDDYIEFEKNSININGHCILPTDLNFWIEQLKDKSWVKGVQVLKYNFDNNINKGVFNIELSY